MTRAGIIGAVVVVAVAAACGEPLDPIAADTEGPDPVRMIAPGVGERGYRYEGCGEEYGTCATVVLAAEPAGDGAWRFRGYVANRSFRAQGIDRNALLLFAGLGSSPANLWDGYAEVDCGGCNYEAGTPGPSVIFASFTGAFDERCAMDPFCDSLRFEDHVDAGPPERPYAFPVTVEYEYLEGRVYFDETVFLFEDWHPRDAVQVTQALIGGTARGDGTDGMESYSLELRGTAPLRLPREVVARLAEPRTPEQERRHIASATATLLRLREAATGIAR